MTPQYYHALNLYNSLLKTLTDVSNGELTIEGVSDALLIHAIDLKQIVDMLEIDNIEKFDDGGIE